MIARIRQSLGRRSPVFVLPALALLLVLELPASSSAATWKTVKDVPFPASYRTFLNEHGGAGATIRPGRPAGLLAWETPGRPEGASGDTLVRLRADGTIGREFTAEGNLTDVGFDASGTATALFSGERVFPAEGALSMSGVTWRRFDRSGRLLASGVLSQEFLALNDPLIRTNPRGDALVVWSENVADTVRLRVSTHRVGQKGFTPPVTLTTDTKFSGSTSAAMSTAGRVIVTYTGPLRAPGTKASKAPGQVYTWTGAIGGRLTGPTPIGRRGQANTQTAFDGKGRGFVMWQASGRRGTPQLTSLAPGAKRFAAVTDLDPGQTEYADPILATDPAAGGALVAWSRPKPYPLMTATISAGGRVAARQVVGRGLPTDAATRAGVAVVATDDGEGGGDVRFVVRDRGSARFGKPEQASRTDFFSAPNMLSIDPDGRVRVTVDVDPNEKRRPRLLTLIRSTR